MSTRPPIVLYDPLPHAERMALQIGDATYGGGLRRPHAGTPIAPQWRERPRWWTLTRTLAVLTTCALAWWAWMVAAP